MESEGTRQATVFVHELTSNIYRETEQASNGQTATLTLAGEIRVCIDPVKLVL